MMRRRNGETAGRQNGVNVDDDIMLRMEGRWYLVYTGSPMWVKEDVSTVTFNYTVKHIGEVLALEDRVEYVKNGRMRFRLGHDVPVEGIHRTFRWKAKGVNRTFRKHFEVVILEEEYMVLFFEKTLTSPTSIDILTRRRVLPQLLEEQIFQEIRDNETIAGYLKDVRRVRHGAGVGALREEPSP